MKHLKLILIILTFISCNEKEEETKDLQLIDGNWYSVKNDTYLEYYFNKNTMYTYSVYGNNVHKYNYKISKDSIFTSYEDDDLNYKATYKFFSRIIKIDSTKTILETRELNKLEDESNTLKMLLDNHINMKIYERECIKRERRKMRSFIKY